MKNVRLLIVLASILMLPAAHAGLADSIAAGRAALVAGKLSVATGHFKSAVTSAPFDAEANVLYGIARVLVVEDTPAAQALLTKLGVSTTGRNVFKWRTRLPSRLTSPATSDEAEAFVLTKCVDELNLAEQNLAVAMAPGFTLTLSAAETHGVPLTLDKGDVDMIRALIKGVVCGAHLLDTQETNLRVIEIDLLLRTNALTIERLLRTKPTLFTAETNAGAAAALGGLAFAAAVDAYEAAILFIRARTVSTGRLIVLDPSQDAAEAEYRVKLIRVRDSLNGVLAFDERTSVDASAFVSAPVGLRGLLPTPYKNNGPTGTARLNDPSFGGVLPDMTEARALDWFTALKHDLDRGFRFRDDPSNPAVILQSPRGPVNFAGSDTVVVNGTATDNTRVARVVVETDRGEMVEAQLTGADPRRVQWQATVPVRPGRNTLTVSAYDEQPNRSRPVVSAFDFVKMCNVVFTVQGTGRVTKLRGGQPVPFGASENLLIGTTTTLTATPGVNFVFEQWMQDAATISSRTKLSFEPPNLATTMLTAVFIPNPFPAEAGVYNDLLSGQIYDAQTDTFVPASGLFSLIVGAKGTFTLSGRIGDMAFSARGAFDGFGNASIELRRPGGRSTFIFVSLYLGFGEASVLVYNFDLGFFGSGYAYRSTSTELLPAKMTAVFTPNPFDSLFIPDELRGSGYAMFNRGSNGMYRVVGALADGAPISFSATPQETSGVPQFPFFQQTGALGSVSGYVSFDPLNAGLSGQLHWMRPGVLGGNPENMIDVQLDTRGAAYTPPARGQRVAPLDADGNATLEVLGAEFGNPGSSILRLSSAIHIAPTGSARAEPPNLERAAFTLTPATGFFSGSYLDAGVKRRFKGVLVQPLLDADPFDPAIGEGFSLQLGLSDLTTLTIFP